MGWTPEQQRRLTDEKRILDRHLPGFRWDKDGRDTYVEGVLRTNAGNRYRVRLVVPSDVPNSVPRVLVTEPRPLRGHGGRDLAAEGVSADMHMLKPVGGAVTICHYHPERWTPRATFYKCLMKARLWLEALDGHRQTGRPIDHYLRHQGASALFDAIFR